jgi:hypothetical protein
MLTAVLTLCGQVSGGPSGVVDQSLARMRVPISPPPASHAQAARSATASIEAALADPTTSQTPKAVYRSEVEYPSLSAVDNYVILRNARRTIARVRRSLAAL